MRPDPAAQSYSFPRAKRLTRGPEIEQVRKEGKRMRSASLEVRAIASLHAFARVGIVVPRYGHSAVDRNRLKRQLRELIRLQVLPTLPPVDTVWRTTPRAYSRPFAALGEEVQKLGRQLVTQTLPTRSRSEHPPAEPPGASAP